MEIVSYMRKVIADGGVADEDKIDKYFSTYAMFNRVMLGVGATSDKKTTARGGGQGRATTRKRKEERVECPFIKDTIPDYVEQSPDYSITEIPPDIDVRAYFELVPLIRSRKSGTPADNVIAIAKPRKPNKRKKKAQETEQQDLLDQ